MQNGQLTGKASTAKVASEGCKLLLTLAFCSLSGTSYNFPLSSTICVLSDKGML